MRYQVAVCGPARCTPQEAAAAREVGRLLAGRGVVVLCGGGGGVMAAAVAGARAAGGLVVGVRPDLPEDVRDDDATGDLAAVLWTGLGQARNAVLVRSADAVLAVGCSWGTLSEIALARRRGTVPVVALGGWRITDADGREPPGITRVATPAEAVRAACDAGRVSEHGARGPEVRIEYCTRCRWLPRAAWLAQELLTTFEAELAGVTLVPGTGGVFAVSLDGEPLWNRSDDGFPDPAAIKRLVRDRVAPGRSLGHSDAPGGTA
jgi:uncharacterized protein (TIGR00725 family)